MTESRICLLFEMSVELLLCGLLRGFGRGRLVRGRRHEELDVRHYSLVNCQTRSDRTPNRAAIEG